MADRKMDAEMAVEDWLRCVFLKFAYKCCKVQQTCLLSLWKSLLEAVVGNQNTVIKCGGAYNKVSACITDGREMTYHSIAGGNVLA